MDQDPGLVVMLGSGETAPTTRKVYKWLFDRLGEAIHIGILETPAGFEPNSDRVAGRVAKFITHRLQNFQPQTTIIPARKRGTPCSPDNAGIISPLYATNINYLGAGSPTYAVRQLQDTLAWHTLVARHRLGASIILASASTLAFGAHTMPVYEIYKVGEDLHWHLGLDFFGLYGLSLVFVPHWNNTEGGAELDTSRCYMGQERFNQLLTLLPPNQTVVGIDEHTALVLDFPERKCRVMGKGGVTLIKNNRERRFESDQNFDMTELGPYTIHPPENIVPPDIWRKVLAAHDNNQNDSNSAQPSATVLALVNDREDARAKKDWATADHLRDQIEAHGWNLMDTPSGPQLQPKE